MFADYSKFISVHQSSLQVHIEQGYTPFAIECYRQVTDLRKQLIDECLQNLVPDKEEAKTYLTDLTKIILGYDGLAQKHYNNIDLAPAEERLSDAIALDPELMQIFS